MWENGKFCNKGNEIFCRTPRSMERSQYHYGMWMNNVPSQTCLHPQVTVHCVTWMGTLPPHIGGHEEDVTLVTQSSVWSFLGSVLCNQLTLS